MKQAVCLARLNSAGIEAETAAVPSDKNKNCSIDTPVRLKSVQMKNDRQRSLMFPDQPLLSCAYAAEFVHFMATLADPYAKAMLHADIASVQTGPGYECRTRNHVANAKLSAHANGLAADIAAIKLEDGRVLKVGENKSGPEKDYLQNLGKAACGFFSTVLGPNGDPMHKDHLHFDAEPRKTRGSGHFCQP
ncbi:MAG: extensin family protein [Pseudomonadota bacterium]